MSAQKGSNGIKDGEANLRIFLAWIEGVNDFKPYIHQGALSISRIAREAGLNRDVFYTNPEIRDVHFPQLVARLEEQGVFKQRIANPLQDMSAQRGDGNLVDGMRIKQLQEECEAVKAQNLELRAQLERYKNMDEILTLTGRLPW